MRIRELPLEQMGSLWLTNLHNPYFAKGGFVNGPMVYVEEKLISWRKNSLGKDIPHLKFPMPAELQRRQEIYLLRPHDSLATLVLSVPAGFKGVSTIENPKEHGAVEAVGFQYWDSPKGTQGSHDYWLASFPFGKFNVPWKRTKKEPYWGFLEVIIGEQVIISNIEGLTVDQYKELCETLNGTIENIINNFEIKE